MPPQLTRVTIFSESLGTGHQKAAGLRFQQVWQHPQHDIAEIFLGLGALQHADKLRQAGQRAVDLLKRTRAHVNTMFEIGVESFQRILRFALFVDVGHDHHVAVRVAAALADDSAQRQLDPDDAAVFSQQSPFDLKTVDLARAQSCCQGGVIVLFGGMKDGSDVVTQQLKVRIPGDLAQTLIDLDPAAVGINGSDPGGSVLEQSLQILLTLVRFQLRVACIDGAAAIQASNLHGGRGVQPEQHDTGWKAQADQHQQREGACWQRIADRGEEQEIQRDRRHQQAGTGC